MPFLLLQLDVQNQRQGSTVLFRQRIIRGQAAIVDLEPYAGMEESSPVKAKTVISRPGVYPNMPLEWFRSSSLSLPITFAEVQMTPHHWESTTSLALIPLIGPEPSKFAGSNRFSLLTAFGVLQCRLGSICSHTSRFKRCRPLSLWPSP